MSLWIETPTVVDTVTGATLLKFDDGRWSLDGADWLSNSVVELWLRKYPGAHIPTGVRVTVDCVAKTAHVGDETLPLREVERALNQTLTWPQAPPPEVPRGVAGVLKRLYKLWRNAP